MLVTQQPVLRRFWYGLMPLGDLAGGPKPFTLLGENIVLWLDADGKPAAVQDRCCHRTAPLSMGFVDKGAIACGYHGWTFDRDGKCIRIPQQASVPPRIRVPAYRCEARYGYVWVCLGEPLTGIPEVPEFRQPGYRVIHEFSDTWDCNVMRLIENAFDNAHFSYVHAASFGNQAQPEPASLTITQKDWGFVMDTVVPVRNDEKLKATLRMDVAETMRTYQKTWWMPFSVMMRLSYPNGLVHVIAAMITPIDDKRLQFTQFVVRNDTEADASAESVIAWDKQVTSEDRIFLSRCDYDVALDVRAPDEFHMASDRPGLEVRRRLLELLRQHGETEARLPGRTAAGAQSMAAE